MRAMNAVRTKNRAARDKDRRMHIAAGTLPPCSVPHSFDSPSMA